MIAGFPTRRCCLRISAAVAAVPTTHDFQLTSRDSPSSAKNPRYEPKETSCRSATIGNSDRHQQYAKLPI